MTERNERLIREGEPEASADPERFLPEMDALLAEMAEDAPEMPADFHERWTRAVRAEAAASAEPEQKATRPRRGWTVQARRLAGAAAVMIFLIGGTLLSRDSLREKTLQTTAVQAPRTESAGHEEAPAAAGESAAERAGEAETAAAEADAAHLTYAAGEAAEADEAAAMENTDAAAPMEEAAPMSVNSFPMTDEDSGTVTADGALAGTAKSAQMKEAAPAEESAAGSARMEAEEPQADAPAAAAEEEAGAVPETDAEERAGEEQPETENALLRFLRDLGAFAGRMGPVLAGAAALWAAAEGARLIRRRRGRH